VGRRNSQRNKMDDSAIDPRPDRKKAGDMKRKVQNYGTGPRGYVEKG